jgi:hypothetical protein
MLNKAIRVIAVAGLLVMPLAAQPRPQKPQQTPRPEPRIEPAEAPQPAPPALPMPRPEPLGQPVNVRLDLTITDQTGPGEPTKKVITMIVADRQSGFIRSKATVKTPTAVPPGGVAVPSFQYRDLTINVDARPVLLKPASEGSSIRVDLGLEYQPTGPTGSAATPPPDPGMTTLNERISVIVEPGKPLAISQAADPASDRRISVELKATILK